MSDKVEYREVVLAVSETIELAPGITLRFCNKSGDRVKIGIDAPRIVPILRSELTPTKKEEYNAKTD